MNKTRSMTCVLLSSSKKRLQSMKSTKFYWDKWFNLVWKNFFVKIQFSGGQAFTAWTVNNVSFEAVCCKNSDRTHTRIIQELWPEKPDGPGNFQAFHCHLLLWQSWWTPNKLTSTEVKYSETQLDHICSFHSIFCFSFLLTKLRIYENIT